MRRVNDNLLWTNIPSNGLGRGRDRKRGEGEGEKGEGEGEFMMGCFLGILQAGETQVKDIKIVP